MSSNVIGNNSDLKQTETICIPSDEDVIENSPAVKVVKKRDRKVVDNNLISNEITNDSQNNKRKRSNERDCVESKLNISVESPSKQIQKNKYIRVKSSEELFESSSKQKTPSKKQTPVKSPNYNKKSSKSRENTLYRKQRTPVKLFLKSPKVNEFDVQVLENFVKITPSKSNKKAFSSPSRKSSEKKQNLISIYISPTTSNKYFFFHNYYLVLL